MTDNTCMAKRSGRLVRTTIISERVNVERLGDMAEAVILNERVKRRAPKGWRSLDVIKKWRRIGST